MSDLHNAELAAGAVFFGLVLCVTAASIANLGLAALSHSRGERWGWLLAATGIATWFATLLSVLRLARQFVEAGRRPCRRYRTCLGEG